MRQDLSAIEYNDHLQSWFDAPFGPYAFGLQVAAIKLSSGNYRKGTTTEESRLKYVKAGEQGLEVEQMETMIAAEQEKEGTDQVEFLSSEMERLKKQYPEKFS